MKIEITTNEQVQNVAEQIEKALADKLAVFAEQMEVKRECGDMCAKVKVEAKDGYAISSYPIELVQKALKPFLNKYDDMCLYYTFTAKIVTDETYSLDVAHPVISINVQDKEYFHRLFRK